jgi:hypothetical protein
LRMREWPSIVAMFNTAAYRPRMFRAIAPRQRLHRARGIGTTVCAKQGFERAPPLNLRDAADNVLLAAIEGRAP